MLVSYNRLFILNQHHCEMKTQTEESEQTSTVTTFNNLFISPSGLINNQNLMLRYSQPQEMSQKGFFVSFGH